MSAREIEEGGGYPAGLFLLPVDPNFNCAICFDVAREPTRCSHDHLFCADCIDKWLEENETCPVDRAKLTIGGLHLLMICCSSCSFSQPHILLATGHRKAI